MAHFQSEYGRDKTTDEFGNPIRHTDDPVHHGATTGYGTHDMTGTGYGTHDTSGIGYGTHGTTGTGYGTHGTGTGEPAGFAATTASGHGVALRRSGSSSSSSSEDDGYGGRRKKGLKEKIKEKLPGGKHKTDDPYAATTTPYGGDQQQEKGMMDKIKEKLPGHH